MKDKTLAAKNKPILKIENLSVHYKTLRNELKAIRNLNLEIYDKEIYGLVGESGCGKSTLAFSIMNYLGQNGFIAEGNIIFADKNLSNKTKKELKDIRAREMSMVYQNPSTALNPVLKIGEQIAEVKRIIEGLSAEESMHEAIKLLKKMKIPDAHSVANRYPHQLSGGMKQRVCIAMALVNNPSLIIMDEPTTNLDVTTEKVILDMIRELRDEFSVTIIYITHDIGVVSKISDRIGIMYLGKLVEEGTKEDVLLEPVHPYTAGLMGCVPKIGISKEDTDLNPIPGNVPSLTEIPDGCVFSTRCQFADEKCKKCIPELIEFNDNHRVSCWHAKEIEDLTVPKKESLKNVRGLYERKKAEKSLLVTENLKKYFKNGDVVKAVDGISLEVPNASTLGIVGESGCGKTTFARTVIGLLEPNEGKIYFDDQDITVPWHKRKKETLEKMQMVFQNPETTLNPSHTVRKIIGRPLKLMKKVAKSELDNYIAELLKLVGLNSEMIEKTPAQLSGGQKQRVAIARAFAIDPELVICDEPTSSLDVAVQARIINLLLDLQQEKGTSYLFISHNLNIVYYLSDYIAVMYLGNLIEFGTREEIFNPPYHPYTEALLSAVPVPDARIEQRSIRLTGPVPSAINPPSGCWFHTRCPRKIGDICERERPPRIRVSEDHEIRCHIPLEELKKVQPVIKFK
jgi:peptide/nickel transport system ATP-binding protein